MGSSGDTDISPAALRMRVIRSGFCIQTDWEVTMLGCDSCTICCKVMKIQELDKPGNVWCKHCEIGVGCRSYEDRPESCRVYECVWLKSQRFPNPIPGELRPDKSRVVIGTMNDGDDVVLYVTQDRPDAWKKGEFGKLIAKWQSTGITVFTACGEVLRRV